MVERPGFHQQSTPVVPSGPARPRAQVDLQLSMELDNTAQFFVMALMLAGLVAVVARPVTTLVVPATVLVFGALLVCIDRNTVPMKRMTNAAVSPVMSWGARAPATAHPTDRPSSSHVYSRRPPPRVFLHHPCRSPHDEGRRPGHPRDGPVT